ncbi:class Ib ribonucleoside-diphosphate reductase assembly flavoprotein NrdI [Gemelliphila palaticanis]|uniref:Class Ib ribonucleoside-diphosphate reductase assembly flavoprotein NrdI n=1 Tax=Gemelliphila palaticanis TaxID=81950 RepID=A0ABX2SYX1_9BACL|nr:class Ib ribonucleoside-diphosphate reductase assembly flavoprotein NrdI [Gemella palaticanis]MBF0715126.1 class Ib ribonucleoside-diphosphate reductase assembly flavoprotein NrdI [Gemella palaticanis]NYS47056.1 class Ib ribonucleoside-diphosphate reductase assembly flavoprotein NrdI [Gemella palaticanis]
MKIVYFSLTGNCEKFLKFCRLPQDDILFLNDVKNVDFDYILVTPTIGFGEVPLKVRKFLDKFSDRAKGVVASGNRNWGNNFGLAADVINRDYNVPILMKFELLGNTNDINKFKEIYKEMSGKYDNI